MRAVEDAKGINQGERLHVQFMDRLWDAGDPKSNLPSGDGRIMFDDHNYVGEAIDQKDGAKQADYMWYTCKKDNRLRPEDQRLDLLDVEDAAGQPALGLPVGHQLGVPVLHVGKWCDIVTQCSSDLCVGIVTRGALYRAVVDDT